jgi:hypothetical protein
LRSGQGAFGVDSYNIGFDSFPFQFLFLDLKIPVVLTARGIVEGVDWISSPVGGGR